MGNKLEDIEIKKTANNTFWWYYQYKKINPNKNKMKSHTKIFLFTTLDMWWSKIWNT